MRCLCIYFLAYTCGATIGQLLAAVTSQLTKWQSCIQIKQAL